jgi:hypothetical protein
VFLSQNYFSLLYLLHWYTFILCRTDQMSLSSNSSTIWEIHNKFFNVEINIIMLVEDWATDLVANGRATE